MTENFHHQLDLLRDDVIEFFDVAELLDDMVARKGLEYFLRMQQAEHYATHDSLTGLLNRRGMYYHIDHYLANNPDNGLGLLFIIDVDRFKEINDSYGHHIGDRALVTLADRLQAMVRDRPGFADAAARMGGDEKALFIDLGIDEFSDEELTEIIVGIKSRISHELLFDHIDGSRVYGLDAGDYLQFNASVGVAPVYVSQVKMAGSVGFVFEQADRDLYRSKQRPEHIGPQLVNKVASPFGLQSAVPETPPAPCRPIFDRHHPHAS